MTLRNNPALSPMAIPAQAIEAMSLKLAPAYRYIMSHTIHNMSAVPRSGINKNIDRQTALSMMNFQ